MLNDANISVQAILTSLRDIVFRERAIIICLFIEHISIN